MTDELTPEEKEAFDKLPRERMPAGLEERVVGAMREHGFLAKRRRVVELTGSRFAGVLAASVALMIGAYSIGLHRGGNQVPPLATTLERDDRGETPVETRALELKTVDAADEATSPSETETERSSQATVKKSDAPAAPVVRSEEAVAGRTAEPEVEKGLASSAPEATAPMQEASRSRGKLNPSFDQAQTPSAAAPAVKAKGPVTYLLNGKPVMVEAPDSARIVQDEHGRMLLIYTSDGVIRIYLDDND